MGPANPAEMPAYLLAMPLVRRFERTGQIRPKIVEIFDPHAQPHQRVIDASLQANCRRYARMRHRRRMTDERFNAAETFRQAE